MADSLSPLPPKYHPFWSVVLFVLVMTAVTEILGFASTILPRAIISGLPVTPSASPATNQTYIDQIFVGAGDIASCISSGDEATAALVKNIPGTVFTLGDNVYPLGTVNDYEKCYDPSWGQFKDRTRPTPGNHDYYTTNAAGYFGYFGASAGEAGSGYYSYNLGAWHIIVLNSNCSLVGGCRSGSPQERWLRNDLALNSRACSLAMWHHPRFSSGNSHGSDPATQDFWQDLYEFKAEVVLNGHDHDYERFALQNPAGQVDSIGIREFVVGTGGASHDSFGVPVGNSQVRITDTYGVLKLTLKSGSYDWQFIPEAGKTFTDSGTSSCIN